MENGETKVITQAGEILFRIEAQAGTRIVDMFGGPAPDAMTYWPARMVELPGKRSPFSFNMFQWPEMSDAPCMQQYRCSKENLKTCGRA